MSRALTCFSRDPFIPLLGIRSEEVVIDGASIHAVSSMFTAVSLTIAQRGNNFNRRGCYFINYGVFIQWNIVHCFQLMKYVSKEL